MASFTERLSGTAGWSPTNPQSRLWCCRAAEVRILYRCGIAECPETSRFPASHPLLTVYCVRQKRIAQTILFFHIYSLAPNIYNSATGHVVWLVRSSGRVSNCIFVTHLHYQLSKTCLRQLFSRAYFTD